MWTGGQKLYLHSVGINTNRGPGSITFYKSTPDKINDINALGQYLTQFSFVGGFIRVRGNNVDYCYSILYFSGTNIIVSVFDTNSIVDNFATLTDITNYVVYEV